VFVSRYSLDEGETWNSYAFSSDKLIVYGLLTEPGEKTTIFSIFGSRAVTHSWMVIKVDLRSALGIELYNASLTYRTSA